jgi:3-dehydroquinate synthase
MQHIELQHGNGVSKICVGNQIINSGFISSECAALGNYFVIITDKNVANLYALPLAQQLDKLGKDCNVITLAPGEHTKTRATKEKIEDAMLADGCGRDAVIIAVGGGVVTDVAGFVAATYCRGIKAIYVPTTLLAMVDAAVGGKTGVNTEFGKNMIGCFYQPMQVFCDVAVLHTLSHDQLADGLVESIKHALIVDPNLFSDIDNILDLFVTHQRIDDVTLEDLVWRSIKIKSDIVMQDEREHGGVRQLLNFGHTIAHAIELELQYEVSHGQAVLAGLWIASQMSQLLGHLSDRDLNRIHAVLEKIKYDNKMFLDPVQVANLPQHMVLDKKSIGKEARFILLNEIGSTLVQKNNHAFPVAADVLLDALNLWSVNQE